MTDRGIETTTSVLLTSMMAADWPGASSSFDNWTSPVGVEVDTDDLFSKEATRSPSIASACLMTVRGVTGVDLDVIVTAVRIALAGLLLWVVEEAVAVVDVVVVVVD
eukprot:CAMPEP_0115109864 /NCGR_PEP_ID=MMETSP0227-20121206/38993_1 /TAXON_ID=89957 /ORGANISM="Polarella glacialis, Strain CCMP 1383" /LENGTH=106 /DNA_ID=CAMNT_0002508711 /DNA_START=85 /DNA_END=402 /DNA_ORIENTATION=-